MVECEHWQERKYHQGKHAVPGVEDAVAVECLIHIQQIIVAQGKDDRELLKHSVHRSHWIGETCQRKRENAPKRTQAHGKTHLTTHSKKKHSQPLCSQHCEHSDEYHRQNTAVAWELKIAVEAHGKQYGDKPEHQGLWQQFAHNGGEWRFARYAIKHKLRVAFPLYAYGVGRREHHQENEDARYEHIVEIHRIVEVWIIERVRLYLDRLNHTHGLRSFKPWA